MFVRMAKMSHVNAQAPFRKLQASAFPSLPTTIRREYTLHLELPVGGSFALIRRVRPEGQLNDRPDVRVRAGQVPRCNGECVRVGVGQDWRSPYEDLRHRARRRFDAGHFGVALGRDARFHVKHWPSGCLIGVSLCADCGHFSQRPAAQKPQRSSVAAQSTAWSDQKRPPLSGPAGPAQSLPWWGNRAAGQCRGAEMRLVYCHLPYCFRDVSDLSGRFL